MEKKENEVVDYYDSIAANYDDSRFGNSYGHFIDAEERRVLNQLIDVEAEELRLDMACGTGRLTNYATHGLDASAEMMKLAIDRHPSVSFTQASACETGFPDNHFDVVYTFHLLMHLDKQTVKEVFNEVYRILKPGGRFIMDIPSEKRRRLFHHKQTSWHGGTQMSLEEIRRMTKDIKAGHKNADGEIGHFTLNRSFGILMLPLHRLPTSIRKPLLRLDYSMANGWMKEYSSYLICELVKEGAVHPHI